MSEATPKDLFQLKDNLKQVLKDLIEYGPQGVLTIEAALQEIRREEDAKAA